ncbi:hypothetical protein SRB17_01990 [Streptomyces sp. RB17]|nr:hypothetical protein [Streptomyces sp. RB17]
MSTTTSYTPPESEGQPAGALEVSGYPDPVIQSGDAEVPVRLFRRDDPDALNPMTVSLRSAVVVRRQGTGEQPRLADPGRRPLPEIDPELVERPAPAVSGAAGVLAGACGIAGGLATAWWTGQLPSAAVHALRLPASLHAGLGPAQWAAYAGAWLLALLGFGGLTRGRTGQAWVLGLFGRYRGTVRRTGLLWVNPLLQRHRVDVRLRHWRSEAMPAADPDGASLRVAVLVVWRMRDTARAMLGIDDHETYLRECVEAALARVPVEPAGGTQGGPAASGDALTRLVAEETAPVGLEVFSVQPLQVEYAPEVAL